MEVGESLGRQGAEKWEAVSGEEPWSWAGNRKKVRQMREHIRWVMDGGAGRQEEIRKQA